MRINEKYLKVGIWVLKILGITYSIGVLTCMCQVLIASGIISYTCNVDLNVFKIIISSTWIGD